MTTGKTCIKPHESSAVNLLHQILLVYIKQSVQKLWM